MSLNQIYENPLDTSVKSWQNYRFNNLNISDSFNIDTTGANPGDVLEIGAANALTWVPFSSTVSEPLGYATGNTSANSITINNKVLLEINNYSSSSEYSLVSGKIKCDAIYAPTMVFLNISCVPTTTSMPIFFLSLIRNGVEYKIGKTSPYRISLSTNTQYVTCSCNIPIDLILNDELAIYGELTSSSTTNCQVITDETSISLMKLN
jgi:hypothetical protein